MADMGTRSLRIYWRDNADEACLHVDEFEGDEGIGMAIEFTEQEANDLNEAIMRFRWLQQFLKHKVNAKQAGIQPLTSEFVAEAMLLTQEVFRNDDQETIQACFQEAVDPGSQPKFMEAHECSDIRYWVVVKDGKVAGVTGFYDKTHQPGVIWISWFCVHPGHRRAGIGASLLRFIVSQAKREGYEYLKLFTANHEDERAAHRLYKRFEFEETHRERREGQELIFLQLELIGRIT